MLPFQQVISSFRQHFEEAMCEMQLHAMPSSRVHPLEVAGSLATQTHLCDENDPKTVLELQANEPQNDDQQGEVGNCLIDRDRVQTATQIAMIPSESQGGDH